jgi:hypothetical protein
MKIAPRFALEFPVQLTRAKGRRKAASAKGATADMSLSGLGIVFESKCPCAQGDRVHLRLQLAQGDSPMPGISELVVVAKVVWAKGNRAGLEIVSMPEECRAFYDSLLNGYQALVESSPFQAPVSLHKAA